MFNGSTNITLHMNACCTGVVVAATPPVSVRTGQLWWNTNDGQLYVWTGTQWVAASCCAA